MTRLMTSVAALVLGLAASTAYAQTPAQALGWTDIMTQIHPDAGQLKPAPNQTSAKQDSVKCKCFVMKVGSRVQVLLQNGDKRRGKIVAVDSDGFVLRRISFPLQNETIQFSQVKQAKRLLWNGFFPEALNVVARAALFPVVGLIWLTCGGGKLCGGMA